MPALDEERPEFRRGRPFNRMPRCGPVEPAPHAKEMRVPGAAGSRFVGSEEPGP
jgi:hypothetical protein